MVILLRGEGKRCKSSLLETRIRVCQQVQECVTNEKLYIFKEEWMLVGVSIIISVEEGRYDHVCNGSA
jgi:hypothetical protein